MHYHQTTQLIPSQRIKYEHQASRQDDLVLAYFARMAPAKLSPEQVHQALSLGCPLTSIRRAITNLTKAEQLVKCEEYTDGQYGRAVHLWQFCGKVKQLDLF